MESSEARLTCATMACLFAALISIGAYIAIPIPGTPVPIVLQNMFIMLTGFILGPWWGLVSVLFYLLLGAVGLPVLSGGTGGLVRFAGPTGGYLVGYLPAVVLFGLISKLGKNHWVANFSAGVLGMLVVYGLGILRLKSVLEISWTKALATGLLPFIPGDAVKIVVASALAPPALKALQAFEQRSSNV